MSALFALCACAAPAPHSTGRGAGEADASSTAAAATDRQLPPPPRVALDGVEPVRIGMAAREAAAALGGAAEGPANAGEAGCG